MELLERAHVLRELSGILREVLAGQGRMVWLSGEAGIGKTTVVRRFCEMRGHQVTVLAGGCDHLTAPRPLAPLADIARASYPELSRLLSDRAAADQIFTAFIDVLAPPGKPLVVIIEDAHWADETTLDLLRFLGRRITQTRALLLVTYRDDEHALDDPLRVVLGDLATCSGLRALTLAALTADAVEVMARGRHPDPAELHRLTGGNPFYVSEVLAAGPGTLPRTVKDAIGARVSRLSATGRSAIEAAAVIGTGVDHRLLRAVAATGPQAIDECIAKALLSWADGHLMFRHELTRTAVLDSIAPARRVELHQRTLDELSRRPVPPDQVAVLAHHAEEAGDRQATVSYAVAAASHAAMLGAHREAAAQYRRALRFCDVVDGPELAELYEAQARESFVTGEIDEAVNAARRAIALRQSAGDVFHAADDTRMLALLQWNTSGRSAALPTAIAAITLLEEYPVGPELAEAYVTLALIHAQAANSTDAIRWAERAADLAATLGATATAIAVRALRIIGSARLCGPAENGWPQLEEALTLARGSGLTNEVADIYNVLTWFGSMHRQFTYYDRYATEAVAFCAAHDLANHERGLIESRCVELVHRGHWDRAAATASFLLARPGQSPVARIRPLYVLGRVRARQGDPARWQPLDEALALATPRHDLQHVGNVRAVRAEAAWLEGSLAAAAAEASDAYDLALAVQDPWILGELALWLWRADALDSVPSVVWAHPYGLQIRGDWECAALAWQRLGCPFEQAAALLDSDDERALRAALQIFIGLGARPAASMATRKLRRLGARDIPRGPQATTRQNALGLTRREVQVLELIGTGCTDAQIGERLFLSGKTVSNHVAAILAKLGVGSRREAADRLRFAAAHAQPGAGPDLPARPGLAAPGPVN